MRDRLAGDDPLDADIPRRKNQAPLCFHDGIHRQLLGDIRILSKRAGGTRVVLPAGEPVEKSLRPYGSKIQTKL